VGANTVKKKELERAGAGRRRAPSAKESSSRIIVVMPAYNAETTLERTVNDIPLNVVDEILLVDDCSKDRTVEIARSLGITVIEHDRTKGYGGNQKTCYNYALEHGFDIVVMLHPDYQYDSRMISALIKPIELGVCDFMLGNRIRTRRETLRGGMPLYKYISNRVLTIIENVVLGQNLGETHSGLRAYSRRLLTVVPFMKNSNDFVFDSQMIAQATFFGFRLGDVPVEVRYMKEASSINFIRSSRYGILTIWTLIEYILAHMGIPWKIFKK
jgi:glycosyltransferase involved in cell wall biosynthesis